MLSTFPHTLLLLLFIPIMFYYDLFILSLDFFCCFCYNVFKGCDFMTFVTFFQSLKSVLDWALNSRLVFVSISCIASIPIVLFLLSSLVHFLRVHFFWKE